MSEMMRVPDGWEKVCISEIADVFGGGTPARSNSDFWENGTIFWATPTDITAISNSNYLEDSKEKITEKGLSESSAKLLPIGSILLTSRATIGERKISKIPVCTNQGFTSLVPKDSNGIFIYYLLDKYVDYMYSRAYGTTFPEISRTEIKNIKVILPKEKKEQEKIAKILSTLDKAIESTNRLIEKEKNIKTALMQELLTNGIDQNGQIRSPKTHTYKQSKLGLIPDEWEVKHFSKVASINMGQSPESEYVNENQIGIPFLQGNAEFGEKYPAEIYWTPQPKKLSKENDILISVRAPVGDINISDKEYCIGRGLASLTIKSVDLDFGYYALIQERYQLDRLAQGSTFLAIGKNDFDKLMVKIPTSKNEQKQIAKILTTQDKKIQTEETNLVKLKELKKGLMNDLLSGKVRVKI